MGCSKDTYECNNQMYVWPYSAHNQKADYIQFTNVEARGDGDKEKQTT